MLFLKIYIYIFFNPRKDQFKKQKQTNQCTKPYSSASTTGDDTDPKLITPSSFKI